MPDLLPDADSLIAALADAIRPVLTPDAALVGIHTGGVWIAERLHGLLKLPTELGVLDISFYRDDFSRIGLHPQVKPSNLPFEIEGRDLILVDDVLYTGRTIRAALDTLMDYGRPRAIRLAVLIDRGHRELPIAADFVGRTVPTAEREDVQVRLGETDGDEGVWVAREEVAG